MKYIFSLYSLLLLVPLALNAQQSLVIQVNHNNDLAYTDHRVSTTNNSGLSKTELDAMAKDKQGERYAHQGKWDEAIKIYKELTEYNPKNADYWFKYGGVLALKAQRVNKLTALTLVGPMKKALIMAAHLNDVHIDSRWTLVDVYLSLPGIVGGSTDKALDYAKQLKAISDIDGYLALGYVYEYDDQPKKAKENYLKGLMELSHMENIDRNQLRYQIGKVCGDYGIKVDEGIFQMNVFLKNYTIYDGVSLEWAYYRLARLYRQKGDREEAKLWIDKALAKNGDFELAKKEKERILLL